MGLNPPVPQQDSNWEIRVSLLLSLFLQVHLIFLGPMRKRSASPITRFIIWSCYLLADWVADLALGLILNNMGNIGGGNSSTDGSSSPIIFAFWTPFLLLHLGGPDTITAYSLEDNELWLRHLVGLLFELLSAVIVILCSVRGNNRSMILATTLMMVVGVVKYGERTYSLYCGSIERFRSDAAGPPDPGPNYAKLMTVLSSKRKAGLQVEICIANGEGAASQAQMERAKMEMEMKRWSQLELRAYQFFLIFQCLFVNLSMSFRNVRLSRALFLAESRSSLKPSEALRMIEMELNFVYDRMYTKSPVTHTRAGCALRCVCSGCIVSALLIFLHHDKGGIARVDVGITYALLLGAVALDVLALAMLLFSDRAAIVFETYTNRWWLRWLARLTHAAKRRRCWPRRWSQTTSQFNLISYCLAKPDHYSGRLWHRLAKLLHVEGILEDLIFIRRVPLSELTTTSRTDREEQGTETSVVLAFIFDALRSPAGFASGKEDIMELLNSQGKRAILRHATEIKNNSDDERLAMDDSIILVLDSVQRDFDESLLLWHIATDLCRHKGHHYDTVEWISTVRLRHVAETLSEYMLYLLVKQPEMEATRTGLWLMRYQDSCAEARRFFASMAAAWNPDHDDARRMLLGVNTTRRPAEVKGDRSKSVLFDAVILAKELRKLDEALMWELVAGVWLEMLMYTASRCRGTTHVRLLNRGGELITIVWFLMANMGLCDMAQILEGDAKAMLIIKDQ